jgi:serine/threonine protein kinase/Flp pilus assembly protein TadD
MALSPGTRLAQYEVTAPLGSGGMGEVYRARDLRLDRDVAIKVMASHVAADPTMRQRFETEARAVAALSHPAIRSIHELAIADGVPFAVMELLDGETLRQRLERGPMPWRDAAAAAASIADGLAVAHAKGIVHRDLKPENVFVTSDGAVKILDFGLALQRLGAAEAVTGAHTATGLVLGTLGYMSPEQVTGEQVDGRSDIFAGGCLLYEMLTGSKLFGGFTPQETVANLLREGPRNLKALTPVAPAELMTVLSRCLERRPERRFESAAHLSSALRGLLTGSTPRSVGAGARPRGKSLAVLPFLNSGADEAIEYLTDGITESIINSLSQLPGLRVIPRSLAFRYKGLQADPATIGLALNARTILTGRVTRQGDHLDIQAELVDTANEAQLWGERFRHQVADVMAVQEEIAWQISEALRLRLSQKQKKTLRKRPTVNAEAYHEYLRGRHFWHNWGPDNLKRAVEHFQKALEHDPSYALAYAGLGHAYGALAYYSVLAPAEGFPRARAAAERAIELDSRLADAHATLALERLFWGWDWRAADEAYRRAMELNPDEPIVLTMFALYHSTCGRHDEALALSRKAYKLDPLSPFVGIGVGWAHHFAGQHEAVVREMTELLTVHPGMAEAGNMLFAALSDLGRHEEALAVVEKQRLWQIPFDADALRNALRSGGATAMFREQLDQMNRVPGLPASLGFAFAILHLKIGEVDRALDHLERMVDEHVGGVVFLGTDPCLSHLRGNPRYDTILARAGVPAAAMMA